MKKKKGTGIKLWGVLTPLFAILTVAAIISTNYAKSASQAINIFLKVDTYKVEGGGEPMNYFETGFSSAEELEAHDKEVAEQLTGEGMAPLEYQEVRGMEGVKEASYELPGKTVRVCVASGLHNVKRVLDGIRDGSLQYDFVEFMACPGGCINGGGQPIQHANVRNFTDIKALRAAALYRQDEGMTYRRSHENPVVQKVYADFLGEPGSHKAHALLHCSYIKQKRYRV